MAYVEVWCSPNGEGTFMERAANRWALRSSVGRHVDGGGNAIAAVDWRSKADRLAAHQIQNLEFQRAGRRLTGEQWRS